MSAALYAFKVQPALTPERLAQIIDEHTAAPELLAECRALLSIVEKLPQPATHDGLTLADRCANTRRVIARAQ